MEGNVWLGNILKEYPSATIFFLIFYVIPILVISLIDKIKRVVRREPKLSKLIKLQQHIGDKDKRLMDFMDIQIKRELFKQSTGYFSCAINKRIVDFYILNNDKYSWDEIKLIISKFEIREDQLKLKLKNRFTRVIELAGYAYYGSSGLLSILLALSLIFFKTKFLILIIPLLALFTLSAWMILIYLDKERIYKKMLLEPSLKDEVKTELKVNIS